MRTPIIEFIRQYEQSGTARLHMPGHKGRGMLGCEAWDLTEIAGADDLSAPSGIIAESEENASALFGSRHSFYSTGGSSQCIKAMLYLAFLHRKEQTQRRILAGRNAHKAFLHGCALLGIEPVWLYGAGNTGLCSCEVTAEELAAALSAFGKERPLAVYLTAPDYLGGSPELAAASAVCRRFSVPLLVDNAHGAYLRFLPESRHPLDLGADLCCDSAHKTLPVLTGGAYLHVAERCREAYEKEARQALSLFGSSSPSYIVLASLDACNAALAEALPRKLAAAAKRTERLKAALKEQGVSVREGEAMKLVIDAAASGTSGEALAARLREAAIEPEFADMDSLVLMCSSETSEEEFDRIEAAFSGFCPGPERVPLTLPKAGKRVCSLREAMLSPQEQIPVSESVGRICAGTAVSCPPAIPVAVPGEVITEEAAAYMKLLQIEIISVIKEKDK